MQQDEFALSICRGIAVISSIVISTTSSTGGTHAMKLGGRPPGAPLEEPYENVTVPAFTVLARQLLLGYKHHTVNWPHPDVRCSSLV
jgi:hypothetical protein